MTEDSIKLLLVLAVVALIFCAFGVAALLDRVTLRRKRAQPPYRVSIQETWELYTVRAEKLDEYGDYKILDCRNLPAAEGLPSQEAVDQMEEVIRKHQAHQARVNRPVFGVKVLREYELVGEDKNSV